MFKRGKEEGYCCSFVLGALSFGFCFLRRQTSRVMIIAKIIAATMRYRYRLVACSQLADSVMGLFIVAVVVLSVPV